MRRPPVLTLITPIRNGSAYFEKTLESVAAQTCKDFEYIVLDAVSTDATPALIEKYRAVIDYTHSRPDKGAVDAFNTGIGMAKGEFIAFLSADDWLEPDAVERIALAAQADPLADVISFGLTEWREKANGELAPLDTYIDPDNGIFDLQNAFYLPCISRCLRRTLFAHYGLHRPELYGHFADRELQVRFSLHPLKKTVIPKVLYHFRKHDASATGNAEPRTVIQSMHRNRQIVKAILKDYSLDRDQRRLLLEWYGFSWLREAFFLFKAKEIREAFKVLAEGFAAHPLACLHALLLPSIPRLYRSH